MHFKISDHSIQFRITHWLTCKVVVISAVWLNESVPVIQNSHAPKNSGILIIIKNRDNGLELFILIKL